MIAGHIVKIEPKAFLRSKEILSHLLPTLNNLNYSFLILMTVINRAGFAGRLREFLAPVLEDVRARPSGSED